MVRVTIWRISRQGKTLWASAEFSSEEKALEWASQVVAELMKRGYLAKIRVA